MKTLTLLTLAFAAAGTIGAQQNPDDSAVGLIRQFLRYVAYDNCSVDTAVTRYLYMHPQEFPGISRGERKAAIMITLQELKGELQQLHVDPEHVTITGYQQAAAKDKILTPGSLENERITFVAVDPSKGFRRYFLVENKRIMSFVTIRGRYFKEYH